MYTIPGYSLDSHSTVTELVDDFRKRIYEQETLAENRLPSPFISFAERKLSLEDVAWLQENNERFLHRTPNVISEKNNYLSEHGYIFSMTYSLDGEYIIVGHSSGLIQVRDGTSGVVLCNLRGIQFPPKPVYALQYSRVSGERVCYAACGDGAVYRIEIPNICPPVPEPPQTCIRIDPLLDVLNMQYYCSPGTSMASTPYHLHRCPALSLGTTANQAKMIVGYSDTSIKLYDMETQAIELTYKVHKLRIQFIPKKLQRNHTGQVCAIRCHNDNPFMFASAAWDNTLRIWDVRCKVGCIMTFEGVNVCGNSIDLNRNHCVSGSWTTTESLAVWDLVAKKKLSVIRVQNRRPNVDGEYIYACRYWNSTNYNRKGKYAIIGGSGTKCLEVINLHNRHIACSYPEEGTILAVTSQENAIAFGGTAPTFNIVSFHDPKHEKYEHIEENDNIIKYFHFRDMPDDEVSSSLNSMNLQ